MPPRYVDDPTIADTDDLWRRIPPQQVVEDKNRGGFRPSSAAFHDSSDGPMSVLLAKEDSPERALSGPQWAKHFLAAIKAGLARQREQAICRDATEADPSHCLVFGKKTESTSRAFATSSVWIVGP
jgi:hypothetical protein